MAQTRNHFLGILFFTLLVVIGALVIQVIGDSRRAAEIAAQTTQLAEAIANQSATLTIIADSNSLLSTATPVPTATPDRVALAQAEATATFVSASEWLAETSGWTQTLYDPFNDDSADWGEGPGNSELSNGERTIVDGRYVWDLEALESFSWVTSPEGADLQDFYMAVDVAREQANVGEISLVFRYQDTDNFYQFALCEAAQQYSVWMQYADDWDVLVNCTYSDAIAPDGSNRLAVIAHGGQFAFFINEQYVNTLLAPQLTGGRGGVMVEMDTAEQNVYIFDNFEVRIP